MSAITEQMALKPEQLNPTDRAILDELRGGRCTPAYVAEKHGYTAGNVRNRITNLSQHGHAKALGGGLYELVDDPREDAGAPDPDPDPNVERLRERVRELNDQLEAARQGDDDVATGDLEDARTFLDRALDALPEDVPGRSAVADTKAVLDRVMADD